MFNLPCISFDKKLMNFFCAEEPSGLNWFVILMSFVIRFSSARINATSGGRLSVRSFAVYGDFSHYL